MPRMNYNAFFGGPPPGKPAPAQSRSRKLGMSEIMAAIKENKLDSLISSAMGEDDDQPKDGVDITRGTADKPRKSTDDSLTIPKATAGYDQHSTSRDGSKGASAAEVSRLRQAGKSPTHGPKFVREGVGDEDHEFLNNPDSFNRTRKL